jgi:STE24 endopeptidase
LLGFVALNWLADLPASLWRIFKIEQRFGFNRTTWAVFGKDQLKGALLGALIGLPLWALILVCLRKPHPLAWVGAWGLYATLSLLLVWAGPRLIAPLFNTFRPLDDAAVQARIDGLMARCGYAHGGLFVMDGSARSTHGNAYFTGLGRSKRVVFFDTLLETLTPDEIEGVLAHELGHFALGHITKQLGVSLLGSLLAFGLTASALTQPRLFMAMGLPDASLSARLLALMLLWSLLGFWLTPLWSYVSRRREYQADAYACRVADGEALKRALVKLFVDNGATLTPHPRYTAFYSSHPPAVARLAALAQSQRSTPEVRQPS